MVTSISNGVNQLLVIQGLHADIGEKEILRGVDLQIDLGQTHLLMGPNGSGKSTLAQVLLGDPHLLVTGGKVFLDGEDITSLPPEDRAKRGMYLGFQYPAEIPGLAMDVFLRSVLASTGRLTKGEEGFQKEISQAAAALRMPNTVFTRNVNEGFSGGEKKRSEILQLQIFQPKLAVLDEFDSGLDVDGLNAASEALRNFRSAKNSLLLISHYGKIMEKLKPDFVHIMNEGKIVLSGGAELISAIEELGFEKFFEKGGCGSLGI